jgi:hypothetical protein
MIPPQPTTRNLPNFAHWVISLRNLPPLGRMHTKTIDIIGQSQVIAPQKQVPKLLEPHQLITPKTREAKPVLLSHRSGDMAPANHSTVLDGVSRPYYRIPEKRNNLTTFTPPPGSLFTRSRVSTPQLPARRPPTVCMPAVRSPRISNH